MADHGVVYERSVSNDHGPEPVIRSMTSFMAGTVFTALGLAVVVDELSGLSFAQTASLAGLVAGLVVLAAAVVKARADADERRLAELVRTRPQAVGRDDADEAPPTHDAVDKHAVDKHAVDKHAVDDADTETDADDVVSSLLEDLDDVEGLDDL